MNVFLGATGIGLASKLHVNQLLQYPALQSFGRYAMTEGAASLIFMGPNIASSMHPWRKK